MVQLVSRDLKLKYKRSIMGIAWSLINPLAQLIVLGIIFSLVLPLNIPNYTAFLFTGILVWTWFQSSLTSATASIVDNRDLVRQPGFAIGVLPIVAVSTNFLHFLIALPILIIFLILSGIEIQASIVFLPLLFAIQFIFTLSLAYFTATWQVYFRDIQYLLGILLMLGFYLSPVFYEPALIPEPYLTLYYLNPMAILLDSYRTVLIDGSYPPFGPLSILALLSSAVLWIGLKQFRDTSYTFAEEL
jgi:lipopolysaccharide transport system permease protein